MSSVMGRGGGRGMSDELYHVRTGSDKDCSRGVSFLRVDHLST